jgi:hypothetical protein
MIRETGMWIRSTLAPRVLLAGALLAGAAPAAAQPAADTTLAGRMRAFLREVEQEPNTRLAEEFFPRRGDWTWVREIRDEKGENPRTGIRRFPGAETVRAIGQGGPACDAFDTRVGEVGPLETSFGMQMLMHDDGPWRRVRGTRFVPAGASSRSPVFVEWRREDGRWVVSGFGDRGIFFDPGPRLLGQPASLRWRDTSLVPEGAGFASAHWFMVVLDGQRYARFGGPRPLDAAELERVGAVGLVSVYVPRGTGPDLNGWVYLPVAPGQYQPFEGPWREPCR